MILLEFRHIVDTTMDNYPTIRFGIVSGNFFAAPLLRLGYGTGVVMVHIDGTWITGVMKVTNGVMTSINI